MTKKMKVGLSLKGKTLQAADFIHGNGQDLYASRSDNDLSCTTDTGDHS